jgi:hypothetical protein
VSRREKAYVANLFVLLGVGAAGAIWKWHESGLGRFHAEDIESDRFIRAVSRDASFKNVEVGVTPKDIAWMRGSVVSAADRDRLRALARQYRMHWAENVTVSSEGELSGEKSHR